MIRSASLAEPMLTAARQHLESACRLRGNSRGFTLIEVLIALAVLTIGLVALAGMFPTGYRQVVDAGRMTMAVTTARQILEDVRDVPFANLGALNGFDSANGATIPPGNPEGPIAIGWQQAVNAFGGRATVTVTGPPWPLVGGSNQLCQVSTTVTVPTLQQTVTVATVIASMQ